LRPPRASDGPTGLPRVPRAGGPGIWFGHHCGRLRPIGGSGGRYTEESRKPKAEDVGEPLRRPEGAGCGTPDFGRARKGGTYLYQAPYRRPSPLDHDAEAGARSEARPGPNGESRARHSIVVREQELTPRKAGRTAWPRTWHSCGSDIGVETQRDSRGQEADRQGLGPLEQSRIETSLPRHPTSREVAAPGRKLSDPRQNRHTRDPMGRHREPPDQADRCPGPTMGTHRPTRRRHPAVAHDPPGGDQVVPLGQTRRQKPPGRFLGRTVRLTGTSQ